MLSSKVSAEQHHLTSSLKSASISPRGMSSRLTGLGANRNKEVLAHAYIGTAARFTTGRVNTNGIHTKQHSYH